MEEVEVIGKANVRAMLGSFPYFITQGQKISLPKELAERLAKEGAVEKIKPEGGFTDKKKKKEGDK